MIKLDFHADVRKAKIALQTLEKGTNRAIARALNRTATTVRAEAARLVQEKRALPIGEIKKAMRIVKATPLSQEAAVVVSGKPISIRHFSNLRFAKAGGKNVGITGISAKISKDSRRALLSRHGNKAFMNPGLGGGLAIMYRTGRDRLPISKWAAVPGLPTVVLQSKIKDAIKAVIAREFPKRMAAEMNYEILAAKSKAGA